MKKNTLYYKFFVLTLILSLVFQYGYSQIKGGYTDNVQKNDIRNQVPNNQTLNLKQKTFEINKGHVVINIDSVKFINESNSPKATHYVPYSSNFDAGTYVDWGTANAVWNVGNQTNDTYGPPSGHSGNTVVGTVINGNYISDTNYQLFSPQISLSGTTNPELSFWMDLETENDYDFGYLYIRVDGGTWTQVDYRDYLSGTPDSGNQWTGDQPSGEWQQVLLNLFNLTNTDPTIDASSTIQLCFILTTDGSVNYPGWYIDDFSVTDNTTIVEAPASQVAAADISSLITTSSQSVDVFKFKVTDDGSDGLPTNITQFEIQNNGSSANWLNSIGGAELWADGSPIGNFNVSITASKITFTATGTNYYSLADAGNKEFTLKIWLKNSNLVDNSTLKFTIPTTSHDFVANVSGTGFNSTFPLAVNSNTFTIRILKTELRFITQPSQTASVGSALAIQPKVAATDINGNVDIDYTGTTVTLSNTGSLTMSNNTATLTSGNATFSNLTFTSGGKYVMLNATDGTLSNSVPSCEIAVDVTGCTIFTETFNGYNTASDLPTTPAGWDFIDITGTSNDWGIGTVGGSNRALTIYKNATAFSYNNTRETNTIAYKTSIIDASGFRNIQINMTWECTGETNWDYGKIVWSTDGINFSYANAVNFESQGTFTTVTYDLSAVDDQQFYIGFLWKNDASDGTAPPFSIDNMIIYGTPAFDYNFSYRKDIFQQIVGTIVSVDGNDGANISLPFTFNYDGTDYTSVRANVNGWLQFGTSHTANAETNLLTSTTETPFVCPLWDDLQSDAQTHIIYGVKGTAPTRVFTIEWRDVLWNGLRQNFQVKLYETSNIIEFWYGDMHSYSAGSASIGINNTSSCTNKFVSVTPATTPFQSYLAENNNIGSQVSYLTNGLVYIFNPLSMQNFRTWQNMDLVIGQSNFTAQSTTLNEYTAVDANSSAISSKGVIAVGSSHSNRVLLWNTIPESNGVAANVVVGQSDFTTSGSGTTASTLYTPYNVAFSPDGQKLLVADGSNNRILIWNTIPTTNGASADVVIGQSDFTTGTSGCSQTQLHNPTGVFVLPDGRLIITDNGNNRVLIYNKIPTTNRASADVVIGQTDFNTSTSGSGANKLDQPWDCSYTPDGRLLISDDGDVSSGNHRILVFNDVPTSNGAFADVVIGNSVFGSKASGTTKTEFNQPSITVSVEGKLAVADFGNSRVMIFNRVPVYNNPPADFVLGQPYFETKPQFNNGYDITTTADARNMYFPYSINFDLNGRLYVNGTQAGSGNGMHRVMVFGTKPTTTSDLQISFSTSTPQVCVYNNVEYSVIVTNNGTDDAYNVYVNAQLPYGIIANTYEADNGSTYNQKTGYWYIPYIPNGGSAYLTFTGKVMDGLKNSSITAYAYTVASSQKDNNYSNNAASAVVAVRNFYAPVISEIPDQAIALNGHYLASFTVSDADGLSDIDTYTASSTNTTLLPVNYTTNIIFGGTAPDKTVNCVPVTAQYGYSTVNIIVTDKNSCVSEEPFLLTVGNIWEGDDATTPTKWDVLANWSVKVPDATTEAIIPTLPKGGFFPIINVTSATCYDLLIEPKASVTLNDNFDFTVANNIYIQSDEFGTGSFVDLNTDGTDHLSIDNTIQVDRYLSAEHWAYISSPLQNMPNTAITENNCNGYYNSNLIIYNEAYNSDYDGDGDIDWFDGWEWPWYNTHNTDPLVSGKGYAYFSSQYDCERIVHLTGTSQKFNTGNITVKVTNQDKDAVTSGGHQARGWNLIGNPYPSGVNADLFLDANSSAIDQTIYFWDEQGRSGFDLEGLDYATYNPSLGGTGTTGYGNGLVIPDKYISISQAFFVRRTATDLTGTDVTFTNSMRDPENSAFFKKSPSQIIPKIKLSMHNNTYYNETIIGFADDASMQFNPKYDGYKNEGNPNFAFYSIKDNSYFVNQALPNIEQTKDIDVPLGFNVVHTGNYTIDLRLIDNMPENVKIYLEDKREDKMIDIRNQNQYNFAVTDNGRINDRFILHFSLNNAPIIANNFNNVNVYEDQLNYVYLPMNIFEDPDNDSLQYSLTTADGSDFPAWIIFDKKNLSFTAIPSNDEVGSIPMILTATDASHSSASIPFTLNIINVNDAPILQNPLSDAIIQANNQWIYQLPENTFIDIDKGDVLSYSFQIDSLNFVPNWINFDYKLFTFYATPTNQDAGVHQITVTAKDLSNATASDAFNLIVTSAENINETNKEFSVFPNPSDGRFVISSNIDNYEFDITDVLGRLIYSSEGKNKMTVVNINVTAGIYYVKIKTEDNQTVIPISMQ